MRTGRRGFTLVEMMVVLAIAGILAALAVTAFGRTKPRMKLSGFTVELRGLLHGARQTAMLTGKPVVVMVFPDQATATGTGRIIVYQDGSGDFFSSTAAVNFGGYDPNTRAVGAGSELVEVLDLPPNVRVGPIDGMGAGSTLPAPFAGITVSSACGFCTTVANGRGAVVFEALGNATFHNGNGPALPLAAGAAISLRADEADLPTTAAAGAEVRAIAIAAATGSFKTLHWKP